jgi:tetratricopeptide (TPR) repeat protein
LLRRFADADLALTKSLQLRRELGNRIGERNTLRSIGLLRWHEGRNREALEAMQAAMAIDRQNGDIEALIGDMGNVGAVLKALGEFERAREVLEEALELTENLLNAGYSRLVAFNLNYILHNLANVHRGLGESETALQYLERSKVYSSGKRLPIQVAYHYTSIAHVYLEQGRVEESIQSYQDAVVASRRAGHTPGLSQSLRFLGEVLSGLNRNEEALPHLLEAAQLFAQLEDGSGEAHVLGVAAGAQEAMANFAEAYATWERTCRLQARIGDQRAQLAALEALARLSRRLQLDPERSIQHYVAAIKIAAHLGERAVEGRLRNSLAIMYWARSDYQAALHEYEAALALFRELEDHASAGLMLNSIGVTLKALGRLDQARASLAEALALHERSGQRLLEAHALAAIGDVCHDAGAGEEALQHYGESLRIRQVLDDRAGEGWMLQRIARTRFSQGSFESARELANRASRIALECSDDELRAACAQLVTR